MQTLKKKLEKQEIVNDRLMRRSMRNEVNKITRRYYALIVVALMMLPFGYWSFVVLCHFSVSFWLATCLFMLICAGATYYNMRNINDSDLMSRNLVEARKRMASAKKFDSQWLLYGIPMLILWFGWFVYEAYNRYGIGEFIALMFAGSVGGVIGAICGLSMHFKTQRQYQAIIDQIEDLTAEG